MTHRCTKMFFFRHLFYFGRENCETTFNMQTVERIFSFFFFYS